MRRILRTLSGTTALLAFAVSAQAAISTYTSLNDFLSATGPQEYLLEFEGLPPGALPSTTFVPPVFFTSSEADDVFSVLAVGGAITDAGSKTALNGVGPMEGLFVAAAGPAPVIAFGFDLFSAGVGPTLLVNASAGLDLAFVPSSGFFGVVSDSPITAFALFNGTGVGGPDRFFVDNFRVHAIPEPGTFMFLLAGLALLAALMGRRARG